jgi:glycosyltransferase 2 family protein
VLAAGWEAAMLAELLGRRPAPRWFLVVSVFLALLLLALALRGADLAEMLATARRAKFEYLLLAGATLTVAIFIRGLRWRLLLGAERPVDASTCFWATSVGYLGNSILPARAGEVVRTVLLSQRTGISLSYVLATAMTERLLDAVALVLISLLTLRVVAGMPPWLLTAATTLGVFGAIGSFALLGLPTLEPLARRALIRLPLSDRWRSLLERIVAQFLQGARSLRRPRRALCFLGLTATIWLADAVVALEIARAIDAQLGLPEALLLLAALGLASAAPSTPGYVGIYQFVAVTILVPVGFSQSAALVYILAFQVVIYAVVGVWGGIGLWRLAARRPPATSSAEATVTAGRSLSD